MLKRIRKEQKDEGFTLIELLIVIVILGILAAIVVFAIGGTRGDSVSSACKADRNSIELSAEAVKTKKGQYPAITDAAKVPLETAITKGTTPANNPLLADAINEVPTTDVPFDNGALLKTFPTSDDYAFSYAPIVDKAATPDKVTGYTLTVSGSGVLGTAAAATSTSTTDNECDKA